MVYVSSLGLANSSRQSVMQAQRELAVTQQELTSNTLADAGLTLGSGSGQLVSLGAEQNRLKTLTGTNALATTRLTATTSALDSMRAAATSFLSSLTSASVSGGSTTLAAAGQSSLAALTSTLNTSVSGQYIFAGINSGAAPMTTYVQSPPSTNKEAVDDAFSTAFGTSQTSAGASTIDGTAMTSFLGSQFARLFSSPSFQGTWSSASDTVISSQIAPGQTAQTSVSANAEPFRQLAQAYTAIAEFGSGSLSPSATKAAIASATSLVTQALAGLTGVEAGVGVSQSAVSGANDAMSAQITVLSTQSGDLDGVDVYALSTKLSSLQTQIQASYELTAQLKQMSLANYL